MPITQFIITIYRGTRFWEGILRIIRTGRAKRMNPHGCAKEWTRKIAPRNEPAWARQGMNPQDCAKEWSHKIAQKNDPARLRKRIIPQDCTKEWSRKIAQKNDPAWLHQGMNPQNLCLNIILWKLRQYPNQNHSKAEISNDNITSIAYECSTNLEDNFARTSSENNLKR